MRGIFHVFFNLSHCQTDTSYVQCTHIYMHIYSIYMHIYINIRGSYKAHDIEDDISVNIYISPEYASFSPREAGMRLRRSIICCSSVLLCAVSASSASAWSIAGLLWTVADVCSSVGCFHTPSIIPFSTTDPLFCTKTTLSRYEGKLTALKSLDFCLLNGIFSVFFFTLSEYFCTLVVQT